MRNASGGYSAAQRLRAGTRDDVRAALCDARERTLAIAQAYVDALGPGLAVPHDPGLNPPRWELGHQAWFQEWWIARNRERERGTACDPDHARAPATLPGADTLFDSSRVPHATRWQLPLPPLDALQQWMDETFAATLRQLDALPQDASDAQLYFFRLVCLHEAMHAEAACYMARTLGFAIPLPAAPLPDLSDVLRVPAQRFRLGHDGPGFAFDNELQGHEVELEAYAIDAQPVSWARFGEFVEDGGYADRRWWSEAGWLWIQKERHARPRLPGGQGVALHLSCHEAEAWCRWAGRRLPTEAEWECAARTAPGFRWGHAWEWTATPFAPYPGFTAHPYRDYSQPWFDGAHRVLRGACAATSAVLADPRYRNFYLPHRSDIFAGFRSCEADRGPVAV